MPTNALQIGEGCEKHFAGFGFSPIIHLVEIIEASLPPPAGYGTRR